MRHGAGPRPEDDRPGGDRGRLTRRSSDNARIATLAGSGLVASFMQTLVTPIYPRLPELLHSPQADTAWVLTATLISAVVFTPLSARLGDMYGKRRALLAVLVAVVLGNLVAALSTTLPLLLVGRVMQGLGIGAIPLGISILRDIIRPPRLPGAIALVSATLGVGGAVGLPLAALVAENLDWHALFVLGAVLSVIAVVLVLVVIPPSTLRSGGRFDLLGALGCAVCLVGFLLAVSKYAEWGWFSLVIGAACVPALVFWIRHEWRVRDPYVNLRVALRRPILLTNLASIAVGFAFFVVTTSIPVVLEAPESAGVGFGLDLLTASLCLTPLGLVMFLLSPVAGRLSARRGPKSSFLIGIAVILVGFALAAIFLNQIWHVIVLATTIGVGVGLAYAAMPMLIMRAVPPEETAAANGLNSVMRTLGSAMATTFVGVIIAAHMEAGQMRREAIVIIFVMGAAVALAAFVLGLLIPAKSDWDRSSLR